MSESGITAILNTINIGDRNITSNYIFDDGHREEFCDFARITRKSDAPEPTRKIRIIFDFFSTDESTGTVESVNSYNSLDYAKQIPFVIDQRASDFIDLRPRVDAYSLSSTDSHLVLNLELLQAQSQNLQ